MMPPEIAAKAGRATAWTSSSTTSPRRSPLSRRQGGPRRLPRPRRQGLPISEVTFVKIDARGPAQRAGARRLKRALPRSRPPFRLRPPSPFPEPTSSRREARAERYRIAQRQAVRQRPGDACLARASGRLKRPSAHARCGRLPGASSAWFPTPAFAAMRKSRACPPEPPLVTATHGYEQ